MPGQACHYAEPGFFRVCYASMLPETLQLACDRLSKFAEKRRRKRKAVNIEVDVDSVVAR
jgi:1-aminocyclopropane-1-carboxylate synthase